MRTSTCVQVNPNRNKKPYFLGAARDGAGGARRPEPGVRAGPARAGRRAGGERRAGGGRRGGPRHRARVHGPEPQRRHGGPPGRRCEPYPNLHCHMCWRVARWTATSRSRTWACAPAAARRGSQGEGVNPNPELHCHLYWRWTATSRSRTWACAPAAAREGLRARVHPSRLCLTTCHVIGSTSPSRREVFFLGFPHFNHIGTGASSKVSDLWVIRAWV